MIRGEISKDMYFNDQVVVGCSVIEKKRLPLEMEFLVLRQASILIMLLLRSYDGTQAVLD
ncbi:hypothetical protein V1478_005275 [Vespula squamosa]|uniref:Uncharacterized protein n=1 Tax=Vespula squamosa TaxID=30214 RepID=A0ABD2BDP2_VESSQ